MALILKELTLKNFLSIGNNPQSINLNQQGLTLVLGENIDVGGAGSRNGVGKAQPLTAKIKKPNGWVSMGDIRVGDIISTPSGNSTKVIGVFPQGKLKTYRIEFIDGRSTEACGNHLWKVWTRNFKNGHKGGYGWSTITTEQIIAQMTKRGLGRHVYVPLIEPQSIENVNLPVHPYVMGVLLGNGHFSGQVSFTTMDEEVRARVSSLTPGYKLVSQKKDNTKAITYRVTKDTETTSFRSIIFELGLDGCRSDTKFIPEIYKNASTEQKEHLIQGLMDSDGYVGNNGTIHYCTTSPILAKDIQEIVWSIGGICSIREKHTTFKYGGEVKDGKKCYVLNIRYKNPKKLVYLQRKKDKLPDTYQYSDILRLRIKNIVPLDEQECQCIMVDDHNHLYITDDYIVTHNTTIVQGLCYALFGQPLTFIKKDNLINKTNLKGMQVTLDFEVNGKEYRIERGRKPNYIRWYVNDKKVDSPDNDEAQGESKWTQHEIEKVIGFNHDVFTHVVVLSTEVIPFLKLGAKDQRNIIEQLLGITQLSEKAEHLKNYIKDTKELIRDEEIRIKSILESNEKIQRTINDLQFKSNAWDKEHLKNVEKIEKALADLEKVDIDAEIEAHKNVASWTELSRTIKQLERERGNSEKRIIEQSAVLEKVISDLAKAMEHSCPTCGQHVHDEKIDTIQASLKAREEEINNVIVGLGAELEELDKEIATLKEALKELGGQPETFYDTLDQAYQHRASVERLLSSLEREKELSNPYAEQIATLQNSGLQEANYDNINELTRLKDHQEFLLKLLTSKDSFIRKKIIDQNLLYMNHRLSHYLEKLNLQHEVRFLNDLNVEITLLGREYDFEQLSTGERKRVILGLNWAFRDVWESLNQPLNLIFIDEILDSGMDPQGVESSLENLNKYVRDRGKSVFLISHREELLARVGSILLVQKENGFTSFNANVDKDEINA